MIWEKVQAFWKDEEGASLIEYVLLGALISIAGIAAMRLVGNEANEILDNIYQEMNNR